MRGVLFWVWGAGPKSPPAKRELERVGGLRSGDFDQAWRDYREAPRPNPPSAISPPMPSTVFVDVPGQPPPSPTSLVPRT